MTKLNGRDYDLPSTFLYDLIAELEGRGVVVANPGGAMPNGGAYSYTRTPVVPVKTIIAQIDGIQLKADGSGSECIVKWAIPKPGGGADWLTTKMDVSGPDTLTTIFGTLKPQATARFDALWAGA